ncbi:hypothetical protein BQ6471_00319 [Vibrio gazogenes]|nr:hypothetical protein BQ6471_00319 [Vibrio gazogenes]
MANMRDVSILIYPSPSIRLTYQDFLRFFYYCHWI